MNGGDAIFGPFPSRHIQHTLSLITGGNRHTQAMTFTNNGTGGKDLNLHFGGHAGFQKLLFILSEIMVGLNHFPKQIA